MMLSRFVVLPRITLTLNASPCQASTARSATSSRPGLRSTALGVRVQQRSAWAATVAVLTGRPLLRTDLRWLKIMATTFHSHGLQFSANCGADFDGGTQYAAFGLSGVDTYAMMDPTCKRLFPRFDCACRPVVYVQPEVNTCVLTWGVVVVHTHVCTH